MLLRESHLRWVSYDEIFMGSSKVHALGLQNLVVFSLPLASHHVSSILSCDRYYVAYKTITLSSILFMFVEMKFIHCHSCVMFVMKSMSMCND